MNIYGNTIEPDKNALYTEEFQGICVKVLPSFVPEQSSLQDGYYFFSYWVHLQNNSDSEIQLLRRHWIITDGKGTVENVEGDGLVGLQPVVAPGHSFEYSSFCPIATPTGNMRGRYQAIRTAEPKKPFWIPVPVFFLRHPSTFN